MPKMANHNYKTWAIALPPSTHTRVVECAEVGCQHYEKGWWTRVDESTDQGQAQAFYVRRQSGRYFVESRVDGGLTEFKFAPGQQCFTQHRVAIRPQVHAVYRGLAGRAIGDPFVYDKPEQWQDDLATQLDILRRAQG